MPCAEVLTNFWRSFVIPVIYYVEQLLLRSRKNWRPDKVSFKLIKYVPFVVKDYVIVAFCIGELLLLLSRLLCNRLILPPESLWHDFQNSKMTVKTQI